VRGLAGLEVLSYDLVESRSPLRAARGSVAVGLVGPEVVGFGGIIILAWAFGVGRLLCGLDETKTRQRAGRGGRQNTWPPVARFLFGYLSNLVSPMPAPI
jgi:hypothetical protein